MFPTRSLLIVLASLHFTRTLAREEGDFLTEFRLKILANLDDKDIRIITLILDNDSTKPAQVGDAGSSWFQFTPVNIAPYPDKPDSQFSRLGELVFTRGSPDPWVVKVYDATNADTFITCTVTLPEDPKVPRLDWFVGWGLDYANTMNEFVGKENFIIECEAASEDILIGRETDWK